MAVTLGEAAARETSVITQGTFINANSSWARLIALGLVATTAISPAIADTDFTPATEYRDRIKVSETVQPLGETPFGEQLNLYKGGVSFRQEDLSFPGTGPTISLSRNYVVGGSSARAIGKGEMADWELSIPRIQTIVPGDRAGKVGSWPDARCSNFGAMPVAPYGAAGMIWWSGYQLITADGASQSLLKRASQNTIAPSTGTHNIVTSSNWMISCLPITANGAPGEAYLATAPDGTRYWFNHFVYGPAVETLVQESGGGGFGGREASRSVVSGAQSSKGGPPTPTVYADGVRVYVPRKLGYMYVTRIEDRFGNAITYNYSGGKPVSITATDGRVVELNWGGNGFVSSIVMQPADAKKRTWQYEYQGGTLARVVLPDGSNWAFSMVGAAELESWVLEDEGLRVCGLRSMGPRAPGSHQGVFTTATITHPSGLVGAFDIGIGTHARSNVPGGCDAYNTFEQTPLIYNSYSLVGKRFSGPGIAGKRWYYDYSPVIASTAAECQANGCVGTSYVDVTAPDSSVTRYIHSTRWDASEGKLTGIIRGLSASHEQNPVGLETVAKTYASPLAGPYPAVIGESFEMATNSAPSETISPELQTTIFRQGVSFTSTVNSFDAYGAPLSVTRSSTGAHDGAFNRTDITTYRHDLAKWVVGQVERVTDAASGKIISRSEYDSAKSLPIRSYQFEMLQQTLAYDAAGNLASIKDGRDNTTTLGGWVRGLPTSIDFPTGAELGADVDALGQISSTTDELGSRTCYGYDSLGRLASTTLTSESVAGTCNTSAWNPSSRGFLKVADEEYGIPGPHWRQTVQTGDAKSTTWYDALLQPVLSLTEDVARPESRSFVVTRYDAMGRPEFTSYPVASLTRVDQALSGVRSSYDALGRVIATHQDSELVDGKTVLSTITSYLSGFRTQVTNPRGYSTTTSFQVFDAPSTSHPLTISLPEGVTTRIVRDSFGKPLSITRSGGAGANAVTATRSYVYDSNERLCKTINPESGATLLDYDAAGNIAWSADGTTLTTLACNRSSVTEAKKTKRTYDALNRLITVTTPGGTANQTRSYHADGKLKLITASNPGAPDVSTSYEYNRRRLLASETSSNQNTVYTLAYGYNANGHASSLRYPDLHEVSYAPDALGRATQVRGSDGAIYASDISYYPGGAISGFQYGNGVVHTMTQNARRLPARSRDVKGSLVVLDDSYTFDANGNVFDITDRTQGKQIIRAMGYDGLDRLTAVLADNLGTPAANDALWGVATYAYDALDNITAADLGARKYRYGYDAVSKRLASIKNPAGALAFGFSYDANGNTTAKTTGAGCGSDLTLQCAGKPSQALVFDSANRLNEVAGVQSYRYDGEGRRVQATDADGDADPTNDPKTFWIYGQDGKVLYTSEARRSQTLGYIYLGNTQVATRAKTWGSTSVTLGYQHTDALGSPTVETNAAGAVTKRMAYTPYGESWGGAIDGTGYTGHVMDAGTGLTYMQQRYYDPQFGRFVSVDPVVTDRRTSWNFNRYSYAASNPHKFTDPDGRVIETAWDVANVAMDVASLAKNLAAGNYVGAAVDAGGLIVDATATVVPGLPGGAGAGIKAYRAAGAAREVISTRRLAAANQGAKVQSQRALRTADGRRALDPVTGKGRVVDHAVIKDGGAETFETTSMTADKTAQMAKEQRILDSGGTFIRDKETRELVPVKGRSQIIRED